MARMRFPRRAGRTSIPGRGSRHVGDQGFVRPPRGEGLAGSRPAHDDRPAFYALHFGSWRDYYTLLHPPYTLWHLSYVVLGAALAPTIRYDRWAQR
jgi:hypothetical protein